MVPNVITYNSLISTCEKGKQPERALELLEAMQRQGVLPDVITYSGLISTSEKGKQPERVVEKAVERMVSRNPLGRRQMKKLHVYAGDKHPHGSQQPKVLDVAAMNSKNKRRA